MIEIILTALVIILWVLGGVFVSLFTGWEINKLNNDFIKLIFWPISIFICKK